MSRNRFLPRRASIPTASIRWSPSLAEVRTAIRNVASRLPIEDLPVSKPIHYGLSDTARPALDSCGPDELMRVELPAELHFSPRYHPAAYVRCLPRRNLLEALK